MHSGRIQIFIIFIFSLATQTLDSALPNLAP